MAETACQQYLYCPSLGLLVTNLILNLLGQFSSYIGAHRTKGPNQRHDAQFCLLRSAPRDSAHRHGAARPARCLQSRLEWPHRISHGVFPVI
ncbi:hypothetical protein D3C85_475360 [compost metagenome]